MDVTADPDPDPYDDWWEVGGSPGGGGPGPGGTGGGGGGGQTPPSEDTHQGEDCATQAIKDEIDSKPTNNTKEHSAIVYKGADGLYRTSPAFTGSAGTAPLVELIQWTLDNNVAFSQVTSLYHNHDSLTGADNPNEVAVNRYPSSSLYASNGRGDWGIADDFVRLGADPAVFKLTIEDTEGKARDFAYADKAKYENLTLDQMKAKKDLPPEEGGCGGG